MVESKTESGKLVDVVLSRRSVTCMATQAVCSMISTMSIHNYKQDDHHFPKNIHSSSIKKIVKVTKILAPHLKLSGYKDKEGKSVYLGNFEDASFFILDFIKQF